MIWVLFYLQVIGQCKCPLSVDFMRMSAGGENGHPGIISCRYQIISSPSFK